MSSLPRRFLPVAALVALALPGLSTRADDLRKFGQWTARCEMTRGKVEGGCFLYQNLILREGGQRVLQFAAGYAEASATPIALVSLPLGISLPPGVWLRVDDGERAQVMVERCEPAGCRAGLPLGPALLEQMRTGKRLTVTFHDSERKPIDMPLPLEGFKAGLAALRDMQPDTPAAK